MACVSILFMMLWVYDVQDLKEPQHSTLSETTNCRLCLDESELCELHHQKRGRSNATSFRYEVETFTVLAVDYPIEQIKSLKLLWLQMTPEANGLCRKSKASHSDTATVWKWPSNIHQHRSISSNEFSFSYQTENYQAVQCLLQCLSMPSLPHPICSSAQRCNGGFNEQKCCPVRTLSELTRGKTMTLQKFQCVLLGYSKLDAEKSLAFLPCLFVEENPWAINLTDLCLLKV